MKKSLFLSLIVGLCAFAACSEQGLKTAEDQAFKPVANADFVISSGTTTFVNTLGTKADPNLEPVVTKGSVCVNGVSLTLTDVNDKSFAVRLIPTTRRETNLDALKPGDLVNIETDLVGKYVCEQLRLMDTAPRGGRKLSMDDLTEAGF